MGKIFIKTILGLALTLGGFYIVYIYLSGMDHGTTPLLLVPAVIMVGIGIFLLMRAGKSDDTVVAKPKNTQLTESPGGLEDRLKMNNEITSQWQKTNDDKNRLRLLEISAAEQS